MNIPVKTKLTYPVSLEEAKRHLRIDDSWDKDNDYIRGLIEASTQKCEEYIGKDIADTSNVWTIYDFIGEYINIQEGNFRGIDSVLAADASTVIDVEETQIGYNKAVVKLLNSQDQNPLIVNYSTGYSAGTCPALLKQAVMVKIGDLYDNERNSYNTAKSTNAYERLLDSYKIIIF